METEGEPDVTCLADDFSFAFDNAAFSDRVLQLKVRKCSAPLGELTLKDSDASSIEQGCHTRFIHVSSAILAGRSPYFMKLFGPSGFKESMQKNVTLEVLVEEERPMLLLLRFMFGAGHVLDSITDPTEVKTLLMLADRFEVRACAEQCVRALARLPLTLANSLFFLTLPESLQQAYGPLKKVVKSCSTFLVSNFKGLSQAEHFEQLKTVPLPIMENLLKSDLMVESEARVFEVFLAWIRYHYPPESKHERDEAVARLAPLIRFPFMPGEYLYDAAKAPELDTPVGRNLISEALWYKAFSEERRQELGTITTDHNRYRMRRYGHFVSFPFQFRLDQFTGLTLNGGSLQSPQFRVGAHEFDVKISRCSRTNDPGTYAMFIGLWRVGNSKGMAECEFLVQTQPSGDFVSPRGFVKGGKFPGPQQDWSFHDWLGVPWEEAIGPHSLYMKDGVMTIRADVLVLDPTCIVQRD